ncbi:Protease KEX1 [Fusarium oxysporum]|uniref:Protease KEX1 n=1 Tax=Fusarium oxysporum TaxID=5507 RepID=A0A420N1B8_FUSOX|nr:Protease KEX1 [Fusarium oxysporum]
MYLSPIFNLVLLFAVAAGFKSSSRDHSANDYYVLELGVATSPDHVASRLTMTYEGQLGELDGHHVFSCHKSPDDIVKPLLRGRKRNKRDFTRSDILDGVHLAKKLVLRRPWEKRTIPPTPRLPSSARAPKEDAPDERLITQRDELVRALDIHDPIFNEQWHLLNVHQRGHDINVTAVWLQGITGANATVAIVDDGLDMDSDDLRTNYYADGSFDFNDRRPDPRPVFSNDQHGTRCAGEVSAARNNACGIGVAYDSNVSGIRILSQLISEADEAEAMIYDYQHNDIYSCSWGPLDNGRTMEAPDILVKRAMLKGIQHGRGGRGSVYVFASGNGAASDDNCNFDGYANSIYSITIGAIDRTGQHPFYSEACSALLAVTYSSGSGDAIHTTDVGRDNCYDGHSGTSAAAPLAAGVYALALQVRPDLSWRDMQWLSVVTAVPFNEVDGDWQPTRIGKRFSHTFGYGKIDSYALVEVAKSWNNRKPQSWYLTPKIDIGQRIPQGPGGLAVSFNVGVDELKGANLERVEHVTVTINVKHTRRGDLSVDLISPEGIVSHMATARRLDEAVAGYENWTFMSVAHWGESGIGNWTISIKDTRENEHSGTFVDWRLQLWGECIHPEHATLLPMPSEEEEEEEDDDNNAVVSPTVYATDMPGPENTILSTAASLHTGRPAKIEPNKSDSVQPTGTTQAMENSNPKFANISASLHVWLALILAFILCAGVGAWLWGPRCQRWRISSRDNYEFQTLRESDGEELVGEDIVDPGSDISDDGIEAPTAIR